MGAILRRFFVPMAALGLLAVTAFLFWPTTSGGFFFDDYANLPALGEFGPIDSWAALARYLTSGIADPTGRPVSVASFLFDARTWPADPFPFKRTNVLLHTLNGGLLAWVLNLLGRRAGLGMRHAFTAAMAGAAIWALHPLWVSTVGYVVQRHAMLPVPFVLLGIVAWLKAVESLENGRAGRAWILGGVLLPLLAALATLSKANGALLPLLVALLHLTLIRRPALPQGFRIHLHRLIGWSLVLPIAVLGIALVLQIDWAAPGRPWTLGERLLTQPRALIDYLGLMLLPRVHSAGVFGDGFPVSTGWLTPWTTLPAALALAGLGGMAAWARNRQPFLAAGLAFFLAGHLIESSVIPLELYFEHRNYLPSLLLAWPLAIWLTNPSGRALPKLTLLAGILTLLGALTFMRATIWGNPDVAALSWVEAAPDSPRAQATHAQVLMAAGHHGRAGDEMEQRLVQSPESPMYALNLLSARCVTRRLDAEELARIEAALETAGLQADIVHDALRRRVVEDESRCPPMSDPLRRRLLEAAVRGTSDAPLPQARSLRLQGVLMLRENDCRTGAGLLRDSYRTVPHRSELHVDTALIATACGPGAGLDHLTELRAMGLEQMAAKPGMPRLHQWIVARQGYWENELDRLESLLRDELAD